jgi:hypothetical protein
MLATNQLRLNVRRYMQHQVVRMLRSSIEIVMLLTVLQWQLSGFVSGRRGFQHASSCSTRYAQDFPYNKQSLACSLCTTLVNQAG